MEMGGDMMWSDSAGFSVSSNLCWAWGCQRVGECLCIDEWAEWERGSHAAVTGRHSSSSLWQVYIPQRTSYKAAHRSESTTIYICVAFQSFNVKIHSPDLMVRATSNCAFTFFFSFFFFTIVYEISVWERTASSHLQPDLAHSCWQTEIFDVASSRVCFYPHHHHHLPPVLPKPTPPPPRFSTASLSLLLLGNRADCLCGRLALSARQKHWQGGA